MNPYDAEAALEAIRPRLTAARARRRRGVGATAALALLGFSSVAYAAVTAPVTPQRQVVVTDEGVEPQGPEPAEPAEPPSTPPETVRVETAAPALPTTSEPEPLPPPPPAPVAEATPPAPSPVTEPKPPPPAPATEPKPPPPAPKEPAPAGPEPKPTTTTVAKGSHDDKTCVIEPATTVYQAPQDAGTITVQVAGDGRLSLVGVDPAGGWSHEVLIEATDLVKVRFWSGPRQVWILVKVHDCALKVETS